MAPGSPQCSSAGAAKPHARTERMHQHHSTATQLLTLEPTLLESFQRSLNNASPGSALQHFEMDLTRLSNVLDCRNPPSDEALLETATKLTHMISRISSLRRLRLVKAPTSFVSLFLAACSQVESVGLKCCPLVTTTVRTLFSIASLRRLDI